jgi:hypothetical protein
MNLTGFVPNPRVRAGLSILLFLIAWILGIAALRAGYETYDDVPATCVFAVACVLWWISYKISCSANRRGMTLGLVALGMWMLNLVGLLAVDFHDFIASFFFWGCSAICLFLVTAFAFSNTPPEEKASPSPD